MALAHCVNNSEKSTQGVKTPCYSDYASNFEIISQSYYGFCYKNYSFNLNQVFRNNYDFCDFDFGRNSNFGKNDFGNCNFGSGFWNKIYNLKNNLTGFLFNRKINSTKKNLFQGEER